MKLVLMRLLRSEATAGVLLIIAAAVAMVLANGVTTQQAYHSLLAVPLEWHTDMLRITGTPLLLINDALMALFFLMIGLEVKHEMTSGTLATRQRAIFPLIAALGGMMVPGTIFALLNHGDPLAVKGWAIPTATDIAFALGILALLGSRVPPALRIFLMALAVIDDLGAIVIIAFFYTQHLSLVALGVAAGAVLLLAVMNLAGVRSLMVYLLLGLVLWIAILKSGVHATLAGVIVGLFIPLEQQNGYSPAMLLAQRLAPWVRWLILPLFAFANAGVLLQRIAPGDLAASLPLGIMLGLFIGKPLGVTLSCWLAVKTRVAMLPKGVTLGDIAAVGVLCGIGFTMSIFIATLSFDAAHEQMVGLAKLGILCGSVISAATGYALLRMKLR